MIIIYEYDKVYHMTKKKLVIKTSTFPCCLVKMLNNNITIIRIMDVVTR